MELVDLLSTPLMHKPVFYGGVFFGLTFLGVVWVHILFALVVPLGLFGALVKQKGRARHLWFGKLFLISVFGLVLSGVVLDVVRLIFYVDVNHTKYPGFTMPSTYPARFAFLYASFCILFLLQQSLPHSNKYWNGTREWVLKNNWVALVLSLIGLVVTALIVFQYNPWTGALWMIWTFTLGMFIGWIINYYIKAGWLMPIVQHRFNVLVVASFICWGFYQGFVPAYDIAVNGASMSTGPYTGHLQGGYSSRFIGFLRTFAPFFAIGTLVFVYFSLPLKRTFTKRKL